MEKLLKNKLEAAKELKEFTEKIVSLSLKTEYDKVNSMIEQRKLFIEKINFINEKLNDFGTGETDEAKEIKKEIRTVFKEISDMDNLIRKNINTELRDVKKNLNQPDKSESINFQA
ncbi:hypothetical protein [Sedimentibacter sp.]|uniref:hypothetical protein n=1 Tax=Sedimentibacter sp. TaxID=1960295 RepID=UPI0028AFCE4D|nr:hypothetical protein [Sedimentibacter sp.]